jgi:uncharacterized protein
MKFRSMLTACWLLSCGAGGAAEAVRPADPTAAGVLGESGGDGSCKDVSKGAEPLVVDWKPDLRGDLEVVMKEGVAVVGYTCEGMKLLKECRIEGTYGFIGMTKKEQVVRLANADEVKANLPFSGGSIGGELQRGSTLEIAMIMVGKKRTTWDEPTKADLKGSCDGATHYVRGATVGAFVLDMGTEAKVRAAAELFGAGTSGSSESAKSAHNKEGEPSDCAKSSPDADKPPSQCGAPIRLVLAPIAAAPAEGKPPPEPKPAAAKDVAQTDVACPAGMVLAEGKCTSPASAPSYQCDPNNAAECTAQCDKGNAGSCAALGAIYLRERDVAKAKPVLQKGCDGDDAKACVNLGIVTQDAAAAVKLFEKGCSASIALGCEKLGRAYLAGSGGLAADPAKALAHLRTGCEGGQDTACAAAADLLASGKGGAQDVKGAMELHKRACDGSVAASCTELGKLHETGGPGMGANAIIAEMLYRRGCYRGSADACFHLGRLEIARNPDSAKRSFDMSCMRQSKLGCAALVVLYGDKRPVVPDIPTKQQLSRSCIGGNSRDCVMAGLFDAAAGIPGPSRIQVEQACNRGDKFACEISKKMKK